MSNKLNLNLNLNFIGRGSAFNTKEGNTSAFIKNNNSSSLLLIDCGEMVFHSLLERKILDDIKRIDIVITHLHGDHAGSLSSLIFYCKYGLDIKPIIYCYNEKYKTDIKQYLDMQGMNSEYYSIVVGELHNIEEHNIKLIETKHTPRLFSQGLNIYKGEEYIHFSGDTNSPYKLEEILKDKNNTEYFIEVSNYDFEGNPHYNINRLIKDTEYLKEYRNKIYCMHIDHDSLEDKIKEHGFNIVEIRY